jgi:hypothetical protein
MDSKPFWASKTLWANIIGGAVAIGTAFGLDLGLDAEAQTAIVGGIMTVINVILRFMTSAPVTVTRGE